MVRVRPSPTVNILIASTATDVIEALLFEAVVGDSQGAVLPEGGLHAEVRTVEEQTVVALISRDKVNRGLRCGTGASTRHLADVLDHPVMITAIEDLDIALGLGLYQGTQFVLLGHEALYLPTTNALKKQ